MSRHKTSVFGMYHDPETVSHAVDVLKYVGFRNADIAVLRPQDTTTNLAHVKHSKAPEGAVAGASAGAIIGGVLGWLAGVGMLVIPGIAPFVTCGPIMTALSGVGLLGVIGGLTGAIAGSGIPEYEAIRYEDHVRGGRILMSIHCNDDDFVKRAEDVLDRTGAVGIGATGEA